MRPYQLFSANGLGRWVDLDTVQAVDPPSLEIERASYFICVPLKHAFSDGMTYIRVPLDLCPYRDEEEEKAAAELERFKRETYEPLLKAWKGES